MPRLALTEDEASRVLKVRSNIQRAIQSSQVIPLETGQSEAWAFGGSLAGFQYQVEGEEDLLHLIVERCDRKPLSPDEGRLVAAYVLEGVAPGLIRLTPGHMSQHFYFGHEDFLEAVRAV